MFRKLVAVALFVSFIAMASSGMMMFFIEKPSFTIQMHPVHKMFGLIMIIAIICHLSLNYRSLLRYIKVKSTALFGSTLVIILILIYGLAINNKVPVELALPMDALAEKIESRE